ncbi:MAG: BACON domain-containing carbohydrate-binding protein [Candidatus Aminicenantes bacterium]
MRKKNLSVITSILIIGIFILTTTSCKRNKEGEPGVIPNAGFRISLSGTANPSTLYVPETGQPVFSEIIVRALNSNGTPAEGFDVIFREGLYGYFNNFKNSVVDTTDSQGIAQATFFLPPGASIKADVMTNVTVTLVDNGRMDNSLSPVEDVIPIRLVPYVTQGITIHGRITTPAGNGVEGVSVTLDGDVGLADAVTVTRPSGSYEFFVAAGWYGIITPSSEGYTFVPDSYTFDVSSPIVVDIYDLDFVAIFAGGQTLAADVTTWDNVPIAGDTQVVNVYNGTGDSPISYFVVPDSNWIHVSPNSGTTPGSFTITVDENTTGTDRNGNITISATDTSVSSVTISISQLGGEAPSDARLAVDLETLNLPWETTAVTINVFNSTTSEGINYIVTSIPENDWIAVSATSGATPSTLTITVLDNYEGARTGQVILTPTSIGVSNTVTITVNQEAGPSIALDIETKNVAVGGETFTVTVTNPTNSDAVNFTVTSNDTWLSFTPTSGNTPSGISITVNANGTGQIRTGVVTFTDENNNEVTLTITQQGS